MNTIWIVLPVLLVLMFQLGIELDGAAFRRVAKHPKALFVGLAGQLCCFRPRRSPWERSSACRLSTSWG